MHGVREVVGLVVGGELAGLSSLTHKPANNKAQE